MKEHQGAYFVGISFFKLSLLIKKFSVATGFIISMFPSKGYKFVPEIPTFHYLMISFCISVNSIIGEYIEHFLVKGMTSQKDNSVTFPSNFGIFERVITH